MKYARVPVALAVAAFIVVCCCPPRAANGCTITLGVGETVRVGHKGLRIGFKGILSDSRCPEEALCFWEGDAAAWIWAVRPPANSRDLVLHTFRDFLREAVYCGYRITLVAVDPYPSIHRETDPSEYRVTLRIVEEILGAETATWGAIKSLYRN